MSDIEKISSWIVNNQDKKGTPDFEIVANALRELTSESRKKQEEKETFKTDLEALRDARRGPIVPVKKPEVDEVTFIDHLEEFLKGIPGGAAGFAESAAIGATSPEDIVGSDTLRSGIKAIGDVGEKLYGADPGSEQIVGRKIGETLGSFGAGLGLTALNPVAGIAAFTAAGAGEARERAKQAGATKGETGLATILGAGVGAAEVISPLRFINRFKKATGVNNVKSIRATGKRILESAGEEAVQEFAAGVAQNLIEKGIYNPEQGTFEGAGEQAAYGGGVAGAVQGILELIAPRSRGSADAIQGELFEGEDLGQAPITDTGQKELFEGEDLGQAPIVETPKADIGQEDLFEYDDKKGEATPKKSDAEKERIEKIKALKTTDPNLYKILLMSDEEFNLYDPFNPDASGDMADLGIPDDDTYLMMKELRAYKEVKEQREQQEKVKSTKKDEKLPEQLDIFGEAVDKPSEILSAEGKPLQDLSPKAEDVDQELLDKGKEDARKRTKSKGAGVSSEDIGPDTAEAAISTSDVKSPITDVEKTGTKEAQTLSDKGLDDIESNVTGIDVGEGRESDTLKADIVDSAKKDIKKGDKTEDVNNNTNAFQATETEFNPSTEPVLVDNRNKPDPVENVSNVDISGGDKEGIITSPTRLKKKFDEINYKSERVELVPTPTLTKNVLATYKDSIPNVKVFSNVAPWVGAHMDGGVAIKYNPRSPRDIDNISYILAHELGHASHSLLGNKLNNNKNIKQELKDIEAMLYPDLRSTVTEAVNKNKKVDTRLYNYLLSPEELVAQFNVLRSADPRTANNIAPTLSKLLKSVEKNKNLVKPRNVFRGYLSEKVSGNFDANLNPIIDFESFKGEKGTTPFYVAMDKYSTEFKKTNNPNKKQEIYDDFLKGSYYDARAKKEIGDPLKYPMGTTAAEDTADTIKTYRKRTGITGAIKGRVKTIRRKKEVVDKDASLKAEIKADKPITEEGKSLTKAQRKALDEKEITRAKTGGKELKKELKEESKLTKKELIAKRVKEIQRFGIKRRKEADLTQADLTHVETDCVLAILRSTITIMKLRGV